MFDRLFVSDGKTFGNIETTNGCMQNLRQPVRHSFPVRFRPGAKLAIVMVLRVSPSEEGPVFVSIRYAYLHNIGAPDSISEWNAVVEQHVSEYDLIS